MPFRRACQVEVIALAGALLAAGCAGGGGGPSTSVPTGTPTGGGTNPPTGGTSGGGGPGPDITQPSTWDTGYGGTVGAPAPASFGSTPLPAQLAAAGGPKFRDGDIYPSNTSFPVFASSLQYGRSGLSAAATGQGATATVTADTNYAVIHLVIPAANVDATLGFDGFATQNIPFALSYVVLGEWLNAATAQGPETASWYGFGYETPPTSMPTTGQATFSGYAQAEVYASVDGRILSTASVSPFMMLGGTARFSADFASGKITGAFTNMSYSDYCGPSSCGGGLIPWNDVSVTASIAAGTSRFSGTTAVTSAPQNTFSLSASATGHIDGGFYGPAAENLGAIWTLSDGTKSAIGGVMGSR